MRDEWNAEVQAALGAILDDMTNAVGVRPRVVLDQQKAALDIIVPKFTIPSRLEHFSGPRREALRMEAVKIIGSVWVRWRDTRPDLWAYSRWYTAKMKDVDTRTLASLDFAERMRRKRDDRARQIQEEAAAPSEASEVD